MRPAYSRFRKKLSCGKNPVPAQAILAVWVALLLNSCAQIVAPSGGPADKKPPRVVRYEPDSAARNFSAGKITLNFNENIQLRDVSSQVFISPPPAKKPEITARSRSISVVFKEPLLPNTTYSIDFGNSILDVNESNVLKNFRYVFSTGNHIDSLKVKGIVQDALSLKPEKDIPVMLYDDLSDSVPFKKRPSYLSKTGEGGSFTIYNIKPGKYKLVALRDKNANYRYDPSEDEIAFVSGAVDPSDSVRYTLNMFREGYTVQYIKSASAPEFGWIRIVFNQPAENPVVTPLGISLPAGWKIEEINPSKDTIDLWIPGQHADTLRLLVSDKGKPVDTVNVKLPSKDAAGRGTRALRPGLYTRLSVPPSGIIDLNKPLEITFNHPLKSDDLLSHISLKEDSLLLSKEDISVKKISLRSYLLQKKTQAAVEQGADSVPVWKENAFYTLFIPKGSLADILGYSNDTLNIQFKTQKREYYGTLKVNIRMKPLPYAGLLHLLDEKNNIIKQDTVSGRDVKTFFLVPPGKCRLRLVHDRNGNGRWDTGNYLKGIQPEKVNYFPGEIVIRSNWDLEQAWDIE